MARFERGKALDFGQSWTLAQALDWRHPHGGATSIYVACEFGHIDTVRLLLEAGAPVDAARGDGATPLYKACQDGRLEIVELLLKHGAWVGQVDRNNMTPLWVACHQGRVELAKILLQAKADPLHKVQQWSAVMLAERLVREEGKHELMKVIQEFLPADYQTRGEVDSRAVAERTARMLYHAAAHGTLQPARAGGLNYQALRVHLRSARAI